MQKQLHIFELLPELSLDSDEIVIHLNDWRKTLVGDILESEEGEEK